MREKEAVTHDAGITFHKRIARFAIRLCALHLLPIAASVFVFRYLIVSPSLAGDPIAKLTGEWGHRFPVLLLVGIWLFFAWTTSFVWAHWIAPRFNEQALLANPPRRLTRREGLSTTLWVVGAAGFALLVRNIVFETHEVLSSSMLPSLNVGDEVAVSKYPYRSLLISNAHPRTRRAELVVFERVDNSGKLQRLAKRVIGVPGDRITMRGLSPVINGWTVPGCDAGTYANVSEGRSVVGRLVVEFLDDTWYLTVRNASTNVPTLDHEYVVQADELFVLGDNRGDSIDSRSFIHEKEKPVNLSALHGRIDWFLAGTSRDGSVDLSRLFSSPQGQLRIEGVDATSLSTGIARCLSERPKNSRPPEPSQHSVANL